MGGNLKIRTARASESQSGHRFRITAVLFETSALPWRSADTAGNLFRPDSATSKSSWGSLNGIDAKTACKTTLTRHHAESNRIMILAVVRFGHDRGSSNSKEKLWVK